MTVTVIKILGSIAAGKTTLAHALATDLDFTLAKENPEANPFLPRMSEEPQRWCFANQVWYINEAVNSLHCGHGASGLVADHSLEEVVDVHTPVFRAQGWLDDEETKLLGELAAAQESIADLYIWLDSPPDVLLDRIAERDGPQIECPEPSTSQRSTMHAEHSFSRQQPPCYEFRQTRSISERKPPAHP